jgi:hypothetical protein
MLTDFLGEWEWQIEIEASAWVEHCCEVERARHDADHGDDRRTGLKCREFRIAQRELVADDGGVGREAALPNTVA